MDTKLSARDYLPDEPRWVETRDLLTRGNSRFLGNAKDFVIWNDEDKLGSVVGKPERSLMQEAVSECHEILAFPENIDYICHHLTWLRPERASILRAPNSLTQHPLHPCRFLQVGESHAMSHLSRELHEELSQVENAGKAIFAAFENQIPVAFCYVGSETESLWDISIDTIPSHRRRGFGMAAATGLIRFMETRGKTAVWGSLNSNPGSLNLALKLGFIKMDEIWVLTPNP